MRADELAAAFASERLRRGLKLDELGVPDDEMWRTGYQTVARDVSSIAEKTLGNALALAKSFVDPVLAGVAGGSTWDPATLAWRRAVD